MSEPFRYYLRVRYSECDAQKVVFNANYGNYVGLASMEFLRALPIELRKIDGGFDYQLVKQTIQWFAPARFDNVLELSVQLKFIGTTSFGLKTEIRIAGQEALISEAESVHVLMNSRTLTKNTIPDNLRAALTTGAPGIRIDHAGYLSAPVQKI